MWFIDNLTQSLITKYLITSNWENHITNEKKNKSKQKKKTEQFWILISRR